MSFFMGQSYIPEKTLSVSCQEGEGLAFSVLDSELRKMDLACYVSKANTHTFIYSPVVSTAPSPSTALVFFHADHLFYFIMKINHHSLPVKERSVSGMLLGSGDPIPSKTDFPTMLLIKSIPLLFSLPRRPAAISF